MSIRAGKVGCKGDFSNNAGFDSAHTGGGNFGLGNKSVKFISDNVDRDAYRGMSTVSGGEVLSIDN